MQNVATEAAQTTTQQNKLQEFSHQKLIQSAAAEMHVGQQIRQSPWTEREKQPSLVAGRRANQR